MSGHSKWATTKHKKAVIDARRGEVYAALYDAGGGEVLAPRRETLEQFVALGYIDEDDDLSVRGRLLRAIFHSSGIMVADLLLNGALDEYEEYQNGEFARAREMGIFACDEAGLPLQDPDLADQLLLPDETADLRHALRMRLLAAQHRSGNLARCRELIALGEGLMPKEQLEMFAHGISQPPANRLDSLMSLFKKKNYVSAEISARMFIEDFPDHPFGWAVLRDVLKATGREYEQPNA